MAYAIIPNCNLSLVHCIISIGHRLYYQNKVVLIFLKIVFVCFLQKQCRPRNVALHDISSVTSLFGKVFTVCQSTPKVRITYRVMSIFQK